MTTIFSVRKNGRVVVAGDGQVSMGAQIVKANARKVRRLADGKVIAAGPLQELLDSPHPWLRSYFHGVRGGRLTAGVAARGDV